MRDSLLVLAASCTLSLPLASAQQSGAHAGVPGTVQRDFSVFELADGEIVAHDASGTWVYDTWDEYLRSSFFFRNGRKCGYDNLVHPPEIAYLGSQNDCTNGFSFPAAEYDPAAGGATVYDIPVVFHIFTSNNGSGNISDDRVFEQITILNEDFAALTDSKIQFHLATEDPSGNPTSGITRTQNRRYYNDSGNYASAIGWDTNRYLNIYSNTAGGNLGYAYVPNGGGVVGASFDGVRLLWSSIGYTNNAPYNLGRTGTHEVGHYLGLFHTFDGGCGTSDCNRSGDLCCDTNPESSPNYTACSPSQRATCGSSDPVRNYMDYSEDFCMDNFTSDQAHRMRCTLENWRVDLTTWEGGGPGGTAPDQVASPAPGNGDTGVSTSTGLSWSAANGATEYDVYFGTSANPGLLLSYQGGTSASLGSLAAGTTYFWRVDSKNANGVTAGDPWSFTTAPDSGGNAIFTEGFESGTLSGWSTANNNARVGSTANSGSFAAELRASTSISRTISVGGATSVSVAWAWRTSGYDNGEVLTATISGGSGDPETVTYSGTSYVTAMPVTLTGVSGSITVTFSTNANRKNERGYVDDIVVQ